MRGPDVVAEWLESQPVRSLSRRECLHRCWKRLFYPLTNLRRSAWLIWKGSTTSRLPKAWPYHARLLARIVEAARGKIARVLVEGPHTFVSRGVISRWPNSEVLDVRQVSTPGVSPSGPGRPDGCPACKSKEYLSLRREQGRGLRQGCRRNQCRRTQ